MRSTLAAAIGPLAQSEYPYSTDATESTIPSIVSRQLLGVNAYQEVKIT
jgi:hypothetical protein